MFYLYVSLLTHRLKWLLSMIVLEGQATFSPSHYARFFLAFSLVRKFFSFLAMWEKILHFSLCDKKFSFSCNERIVFLPSLYVRKVFPRNRQLHTIPMYMFLAFSLCEKIFLLFLLCKKNFLPFALCEQKFLLSLHEKISLFFLLCEKCLLAFSLVLWDTWILCLLSTLD